MLTPITCLSPTKINQIQERIGADGILSVFRSEIPGYRSADTESGFAAEGGLLVRAHCYQSMWIGAGILK